LIMKNIFLSDNGEFRSTLCDKEAYFPLTNFNLMGSITADLNGDLKLSNHEFFFEPATRFGLSANNLGVNVWALFEGGDLFSPLGKSATKLNTNFPVKKEVNAGLLWYKVLYVSDLLSCDVLTFVDIKENVQLFRISIKNTSGKKLSFSPAVVVPVYGRSADNIRDHRHVTSLLNRVKAFKNGIVLKPTMSFDEEGHRVNHTSYSVFADSNDSDLLHVFSDYNDVIRTGNLLNPIGLLDRPKRLCYGSECCFAGVFNRVSINPGDAFEFYLALGISKDNGKRPAKACNKAFFDKAFDRTIEFWQSYTRRLSFGFPDGEFSNWLKWVSIQPLLRKIYGCSFLPDFDYGKGGRGWRDLWQDLLSLLLVDAGSVKEDLLGNFAGVRIDGSNATIIGKEKGEFIADRNKITRVWMDHGVWPFLTVMLYIDQTGDWEFLFEEAPYFRDNQIFRGKRWDSLWDGNTQLLDKRGVPYKGSVLEHILLQHLVQFFNAGRHNLIRLENADWNDGLDMAADKGESAAFTAFYAGNLDELADLLDDLSSLGIKKIELFKEMALLLDTLGKSPVSYASSKARQERLLEFFDSVQIKGLSGAKISVSVKRLADDLRKKADALKKAVRRQIIDTQKGCWVNGYFDNNARALECVFNGTVRMTLTGQVFPIMKGILSNDESKLVARSVDRYLFDKKIKGYRLNTDFKKVLLDMGRAFAFAFGEKENGAVFSHMVVMYANALFRRGLVKEGWKALESLFNLAIDTPNAKIYPCLPEYFNNSSQGMYSYLTGSASWYVMTLLREALGISSVMGDLFLFPKLLKRHFKDGKPIEVLSSFRGFRIRYSFHNEGKLDWGRYCIESVDINGRVFRHGKRGLLLDFEFLKPILRKNRENTIKVLLGKCVG